MVGRLVMVIFLQAAEVLSVLKQALGKTISVMVLKLKYRLSSLFSLKYAFMNLRCWLVPAIPFESFITFNEPGCMFRPR